MCPGRYTAKAGEGLMTHDFNAMYASVQSWIDREFLVGASAAVLVGGELVDVRH